MNSKRVAALALAGTGLLAGLAAFSTREAATNGDTPLVSVSAPMSVCYLPSVDEDLMEHVEAAVRAASEKYNRGIYGNQYNAFDRWGIGQAQGTSVTLRWSIVADGLFIPSGLGEAAGSNSINAMLTQIFGDVELGKDRIRQAINAWGDMTGNTMVEVVDNGRPWGTPGPFNAGTCNSDIRIVAKSFGGQWQGVLAYNYFPDSGDMVINRGHQGDYARSSANYRFLRNTVAHEDGHGLGLSHTCPINQSKLMEPFLSTAFDMVQHDDLRGAQRNYGDYMESNDSSGQASDLGSIDDGGFVDLDDLSIDDNADSDFFKFTVDPGKQVTINVQPIGFTYQDWDQLQNGSCANSGPTVNSLTIHDLSFQLRDTDGSTILTTQNDNGAGQSETLTDFILPSGGTFYIRVLGSSTNDIQIYDLRVDVDEAVGAPFCADTVEIVRGIVDSGTESDACGSDNNYWWFRPDALAATVTPPIDLRFIGTAPQSTGSQIAFAIEAGATATGIAMNLSIFNYDTNSFESIVIPNIPQGDTVHMIVKSSNVDAYIGAGNEVRGRITFIRPAGVPPLWYIPIDDVHFELTP